MRELRNRTIQTPEESAKPEKTKKSKKNSSKNVSLDSSEEASRRLTRKSILNKKENISPNIKTKKNKSRRNKKSKGIITESTNKSNELIVPDSSSSNISLETTFENVVTSTTMKPRKPKQANVSEALNIPFIKIDDFADDIPVTTNNSGQWKIEKSTDSIKSVVKSPRKKWECFARNSPAANSILEQIITPRKKSPTNPQQKIKRTVMPNFALIHQKAFDKMESISDYSQRKKNRALLLTSGKKNLSVNKPTGSGISSRQLFVHKKSTTTTTTNATNRFGFKPPVINKSSLHERSGIMAIANKKPSLHERSEIMAIANKKPQEINKRDNKRDALKGVRTNRRFELLRLPPDTPRSKQLLTDEGSNILIYLTGHGGDGFLKFQDSEEVTSQELADALEQMWQKKRYHELFFMIDTCQAASMYEKFYSPNILAVASSLVGEDSLSHHVDPAIGVYIIDRYTYYALDFLEKVDMGSSKTMGEFLLVCPKRVCISTVGVRKDLFPKDPYKVPITDFFGSVRPVEITTLLINATPVALDNNKNNINNEQDPVLKYHYIPQMPHFDTFINMNK